PGAGAQVRGEGGPAAAALVGIPGHAAGGGVLVEPARAAARARAVHARLSGSPLEHVAAEPLSYFDFGPTMFSGRTHWSNCSEVRKPSLRAASLSVVPSLCAVLAIFAALS